MKSFEIEDIKTFMNELMVDERYDSFYMYEAKLRTRLDYEINGKINKGFDETEDTQAEYICWHDIKQGVFDIMKGNRLPISFKLILMFNKDNIKKLIELNKLTVDLASVSALFFNIYYENEKLIVTTGTSLNVFTMDKTLDHVWDETVERYYI